MSFFRFSYWGADCCLSYKRMFAVGVKLIEYHEYAPLWLRNSLNIINKIFIIK